MKKLKSKLHLLLAQKRMSQSQLARETGLSQPTINNLYNDKLTKIDIKTIEKICTFLNCTLDDLFDMVEEYDKLNIKDIMPHSDKEAFELLKKYRDSIAHLSEQEKENVIVEALNNV